MTSKVISSDVWTAESDFKILEEEQTSTLIPTTSVELDDGRVQTIATLAPDASQLNYVTGVAVMEKEDEFVEPRRIFEEVFGLD